MPFGKAVKYINLSIAVLLVVFLAIVYWVAYRPLPNVSGEISAPISSNGTIVRDARGVPHITAGSWEDAIFLQGFATAQDRMWQMDALRRLAAGDLAEVVGPAAIETDREARRLRMRRAAEDQLRSLPPADREVLAAYARGVNYYIETHRGRFSLEFTLLGYEPRPWRLIDSILAALQMYRNLTTSWRNEIQKEALLASGDRAKVNVLFPTRTGREFQPGSNAWAISGALTASGKPILANDPHLEFSMPATWHMVHLKAPGLNVTGVSLPGVPCVIIGHNERIAWGVTNLAFDVQDLYRERLDPQTGRYAFRGQLEQARLERELIPVKGGRPVEVAQWVTRHGPIIIAEGNQFLALRWTATEPGSFQFPFLDLDRARNWSEYTAALARFPGPGQNFVYADVDGNIGYHATGMLPIRRSHDGDVPVDGSSGNYEWDGYIPFAELPAFYNPPQGMIVTANQNPFPADYPYRVSGDFAPPYRSRQIRDLLRARKGWKPGEMLAVQKDVYSELAHVLAKRVVAAYEQRKANNPNLKDAVELLRLWNGQMEKGTAAPLLATLLYQQVRSKIADAAAPGKGQVYEYQMAPSVVASVLAMESRGWFHDESAMLVRALADAFEEGRKIQGSNVRKWDYGKYNELTIKQPVDSQIPLLGGYFNVGPVAMSGSSTTVKQTTRRIGPSMRFVADFSDWEQSLNNITAGESGQLLSGHYKDQWDAYYVGQSFPMEYEKVQAKETLIVKPQMNPDQRK